MKIYGESLAGWAAEQAARTAELGTDSAGRAQGLGASSRDRVEISGLANQIAQAHADSAASQSARIRELSQLHASGRYEVDAAKLAGTIVDRWLTGADGAAELKL